MSDNKNVNQDKGLQGNEKIEQAIAALQQEATQEMLAHTLTVIRRRMREKGQFILSVEPVSYTHLFSENGVKKSIRCSNILIRIMRNEE